MSNKPYKPTNLKLLEGNRGKRKLPKNEFKPFPKAPKVHLDLDRQAKKTWKRLAKVLEPVGLLTEADGDLFAMLCQARSRIFKCHSFIKENNPSLVQVVKKEDSKGNKSHTIKPGPYVVMEKQYYELFRRLAGEFGLSPRGRIGLTVGRDPDKGDDLLD